LDFEIKYGKGKVEFELDEKNYMGTLLPNEIHFDTLDEEEVRRALANPIWSMPLNDIVSPGEKVVIVTSDITRPMPSYLVLPAVIEELIKGGVLEKDITIVLALGSHRNHTDEEKKSLVGDKVWNSSVKVIDSDMNNCLRLGFCKNGTPVDIFEPVVSADKRICLGNIEFHYFAGYSGGNKAIMPGVSSHDAIQANHSNMVKPGAYAGNIDSNPVRQDIEQITDFISIDFIVNVVLDDKKRIVKAVAGHHVEAHREGCKVLDEMYKIPLKAQADIVILSPGGYPKDINIYQSQKGLDNAKHAVKDGGILIWCASAVEGFGEKTFEEWMTTKSPKEMVDEIKINFQLGGHKAAAIAMILEKAKIYMVSDLPDDLIRKINLIPFPTIQKAIEAAIQEQGENSKILVLSSSGSTLPVIVS
jgi:lactate racemase